MIKKYKVKTGKQLLKMILKNKIKNQLILEDFRGKDILGLYIGIEHHSTGRIMNLEELLSNNKFYIYKNTEENYKVLANQVSKYNVNFK